MSDNIHIEEDLLGTRGVSADTCYGVHTPRAIENLYISNNKISDIPEFVRGMVMVKKATTMADKELQTIPKSIANIIIVACDEVLNSGECMDQLLVGVCQSGASTSVNMNTNEALANIGLELMGHQRDEYQYLNPNNHVNKCQFTNDTYPADFHIVAYSPLTRLVDAINQPREGSERRAVESQDILKVGRIQLQDTVSMTFGWEFRAFSILLKEEVKNIQCTAELLLEVSLSAAAVDTGLNTPKEYFPLAVKKLAEAAGFPCVPARGLIEVVSGCGAHIMVHDVLKCSAMKMPKICNDLRLLSSGPRTGPSEIDLSELQAGSSIMPARVSPVVPEVVNQIRFRVIDNDTTVIIVAEVGQLQLNAMEPAIGQAIFESAHILTNVYYNLLEKCINGITASKEACEGYVYNSISVVTYPNPSTGHHNGDITGKVCAGAGRGVRETILERGLLIEAELDGIFSVQSLIHSACKARRYTDENEQ